MEELNTQSGLDSWPVPVKVFKDAEKLVRLTGLPQEPKQKAWSEIRTNHPPLAALLKEQALQDLVQFFDADIYVEAELAPSLPVEQLRGRRAE
ncbi:hypothetical protein ACM8BJ_24405 [Pseudomonas aeruginosa]|jgi:hypothetical protein|nr:hypothetical protein [Pseudomonas aeruginosa]EPL61632.1 hypothetical protein B382_14498 [Stutzerimonas stutzeri B1SMN1]ELQ8318014.1 hypothetical protein [Pseudomonas aeruginosa]MBI6904538.1 hypothetical protein [Pseudomonas aeruginosa]MDY1219234.1 hypothetical protein [Pseudomonas aeruginosa]HBO7921583.1 hypothetical protein [Pseudomonas aeruginosa]